MSNTSANPELEPHKSDGLRLWVMDALLTNGNNYPHTDDWLIGLVRCYWTQRSIMRSGRVGLIG